RDKHENEKLIRWGWPEDVWFHVDKYSSAHVYLRMPPGMSFETIPEALITDCCQLVKANSIEGCKLNNIDIVYTLWSNLKKTGDMAVGQIGFHSDKAVKKIRIDTKVNLIVNRLNKTQVVDDNYDYQAEREERDRKERLKEREAARIRQKAELEERERLQKEKESKSYERVFDEKKMMTNKQKAALKAATGGDESSDDDFF
ncbi:UNVERIFIED_CONTAM: Coiled-coil domain-containing protein 25, partial [Eudyptes robustus]